MSQRTQRILALFFIPISIVVLTIIIMSLIMMVNSTILYFKFVNLKKEYQPKFEAIKQNDELWKQIHPNEIVSSNEYSIDLNPYKEAGLDNINPTDTTIPTQAIDLQSNNIVRQVIDIILCLLCFSIPWLCIRTFFWIKNADKTVLN